MKSNYFFILICVTLFLGCKKDTPPVDPCKGYQPLKAAFLIQEELGDSTALIDTDTVTASAVVRFTPVGTYDSVRWIIGAGSYTSREVVLRFRNIRNEEISVKFRGYRASNPQCGAPGEKTEDVAIRSFYVNDDFSSLLLGAYRGFNESNRKDTFSISIEKKDITGYKDFRFYVRNINPGCTRRDEQYDYLALPELMMGWKAAKIISTSNNEDKLCYSPYGTFKLIKRDSILVHYNYIDYSKPKDQSGRYQRRNEIYRGLRVK